MNVNCRSTLRRQLNARDPPMPPQTPLRAAEQGFSAVGAALWHSVADHTVTSARCSGLIQQGKASDIRGL